MQYKVIGWIHYEDDRFPDVCDAYEIYRLSCTVIREIRKCGYRFGGDDHQNRDGCVPVFNSGEALRLSMRTWGALMAQAWHEDNSDGYGYMSWYMIMGLNWTVKKYMLSQSLCGCRSNC